MADVDIKYKGASIAQMNASGTKTLLTEGKYCEDDIEVIYTDPEKPTQSKTVTPTAAGLTVSPDSGKVLSSVVINGDNDLVAANVRKNINIFGVTGTLEEGITPSGTKNITENGTFDVTNYASALVNVPNYLEYSVYNYQLFFGNGSSTYPFIKLPETMIINAPNTIYTGRMFMQRGIPAEMLNLKHVHLTLSNNVEHCDSMFDGQTLLEDVTLNFSTRNVGNLTNSFFRCSNLVSVFGEIDASACTTFEYCFIGTAKLRDITFKANTIGCDLGNSGLSNSSALSQASVVSIANGLKAASSLSIPLHANVKAICNSTMGTVTSVTDDTGTYDFFAVNASGTVSLMSFITTTKGWTVT